VPSYLAEHGYRVIPVNPRFAGQTLYGERVRAALAELGEPVDIVDVFRRAEHLPAHLPDLLAMAPRPRLVWLQSGIRHPGFARALIAEGIEVVQDRCTMADHRRLRL
jgi:predicted CoA-binding protein